MVFSVCYVVYLFAGFVMMVWVLVVCCYVLFVCLSLVVILIACCLM